MQIGMMGDIDVLVKWARRAVKQQHCCGDQPPSAVILSTKYSAWCHFIIAAIRSRCGHYIVLSSSFFLFFSPNLSRQRLNVNHTLTHRVP